ncbi:response regulator [Bacillus sp. V2I10]|uniref:response regulator n=1 Tax=Bacillus sp. V2I10 TaxID=3042276 RepID=UPI002785A242|nr:response regulator [Bacillus sp. V2I10]MDQ0856534.1 two-component system response regulator YesN [Bacillus sp. V2I10]
MKALIVDDEFNVRDVLRHLGQWEQYGITKLLEASNGKEAKKWIEKEQPELIFTDIKMPGMTGMELIEWLDSISYPGKVIFITGYNDYSYMRKAIQHSSFDYLLKPIEYEAFNHTLKKSVQAWKDDFEHAEVLEDAKKLRRNQLATAICLGDRSDADSLAEFLPESAGYELTLLSFYQMHNPDSYIENLSDELMDRRVGNAFSLQTDLNLCLVITICDQWLSVEEYISREFDLPVRLVTGEPIESLSQIRPAFQTLEKKLEEQNFRSIHRLDEIDAARRMEDIVSYVKTYYMEDLSLEKLSNVFFLSREHISRKFKQETGMTLSKYITELRISQAKSWLQETDKSIYSISTMLGYQDEIYFSKLFKKVVGMTPFEFRNSSKGVT